MRGARFVLAAFLLLLVPSLTHARDLTVRARGPSGRILAGQGIDIFVDVPARDRRPKLDLPKLRGARMWVAEETFRPTGMSAIGGATASENVFTFRLRLVAESPGTIVVPPIVAEIDGRSGGSAPLRLTVEIPPLAGRPPGFLGGVGPFTATAEVEPARVRVGQEATYRIRVEGPGAWGMTTRPALDRLRGLPIDARVAERPDEVVDEPPSRAFVYTIRPMKAGAVVLPPVAIASHDPRSGRYFTRAANGVPFEVVDAPAYDAGELDYRPPTPGPWRARLIVGIIMAAAALAIGGPLLARRRIARWLRRRFPGRRHAARRFARDAARRLDGLDESHEATARAVLDSLVEYARLGAGRPPGALTPEEARESVATASGSDGLGDRAARMAARCDQVLFAARGTGGGPSEGDRLKLDAQELLGALGRSGGRWWWVSGRSGW
ncbi:hypothetical protein [Paludisphaera sp.]|uniref:hypothetical protein n=1 Tax=Paludisphaera sp. TaxID=2017432 RepID=UPI00301BFE2A